MGSKHTLQISPFCTTRGIRGPIFYLETQGNARAFEIGEREISLFVLEVQNT
jgi:hypothetical protein